MKRLTFIKNIALTAIVAVGATSCTDWLTLYPQDRVVEENFWEDKNDLEGVRYAAYQQMANTLEKLIIWGDLRSDAYQINPAITSEDKSFVAYQNITEAKLDSTMSHYDWGGVYTTINFCNKVLQHGEEVLEKDAQFTRTEWNEMKAEMTALRALNYFYLLRAFKDIPYSTRVINTDEEVMDFPPTNQLAVLDTLISDVRAVAGHGRNRFADINGYYDSHGLMTNTAIYALLAEMYLWRGALREGRGFARSITDQDNDSCIYYGQLALDALAERNSVQAYGTASVQTKDFESGLRNAMLISNRNMAAMYNAQTTPTVYSYDYIFGGGNLSSVIGKNSIESMFELQFPASDNRKNEIVNKFYGQAEDVYFAVNNNAVTATYGTSNTADQMARDCRLWYSSQDLIRNGGTNGNALQTPYMLKWAGCTFYFDQTQKKLYTAWESTNFNNWIVYRMTDVMLMMAEAHVCKAAATAANDPDMKACRSIVDAVHKRSAFDTQSREQAAPAAAAGSAGRDNYIKLVMNERLVEFLGEGKRWFDLVRYAERYAMDQIQASTDDAGDAALDENGNPIYEKQNAKANDIAILPDPREPQYVDGTMGVRRMITDYLSKAYPTIEQTLKNRIKNRYGLYCPIYYMEKKANHNLIPQNPVWNREK